MWHYKIEIRNATVNKYNCLLICFQLVTYLYGIWMFSGCTAQIDHCAWAFWGNRLMQNSEAGWTSLSSSEACPPQCTPDQGHWRRKPPADSTICFHQQILLRNSIEGQVWWSIEGHMEYFSQNSHTGWKWRTIQASVDNLSMYLLTK